MRESGKLLHYYNNYHIFERSPILLCTRSVYDPPERSNNIVNLENSVSALPNDNQQSLKNRSRGRRSRRPLGCFIKTSLSFEGLAPPHERSGPFIHLGRSPAPLDCWVRS